MVEFHPLRDFLVSAPSRRGRILAFNAFLFLGEFLIEVDKVPSELEKLQEIKEMSYDPHSFLDQEKHPKSREESVDWLEEAFIKELEAMHIGKQQAVSIGQLRNRYWNFPLESLPMELQSSSRRNLVNLNGETSNMVVVVTWSLSKEIRTRVEREWKRKVEGWSFNIIDVVTNLRRSTRKRKISINLEDYETDSSRTDDDLMAPRYRSSRNKVENNVSHDELSTSPRNKKALNAKILPRREGLRPRKSLRGVEIQPYQGSEDEHESSEAHAEPDEVENGNTVEEDGVDEADGGGDEVEMDEDDEDGEENDGRRRYDLRN
ncbi:hypothetical protein HPP92_008993 [Vanilla planifolia]|uniref:Uncharacterized protein n=1 Tax=Vanilla planifolia TaxID=51239 RepID=A0A835V2F8_VANPL|nr:hypothetical protein HPP92_008993 [Vanilla planifolia]